VPKHAPPDAVRGADSTLTASAEACAADIPEVALEAATFMHRDAEGRDRASSKESPLVPPCAGGTGRMNCSLTEPKPGHRAASADAVDPLPPAAASQARRAARTRRVRPDPRVGPPPPPSHPPAETGSALSPCGLDRVGQAIRRANPPRPVAPRYAVPSPRSRRGRSCQTMRLRRFPGASAFTASVPFDRRAPESARRSH
jgi:hypothetical protein